MVRNLVVPLAELPRLVRDAEHLGAHVRKADHWLGPDHETVVVAHPEDADPAWVLARECADPRERAAGELVVVVHEEEVGALCARDHRAARGAAQVAVRASADKDLVAGLQLLDEAGEGREQGLSTGCRHDDREGDVRHFHILVRVSLQDRTRPLVSIVTPAYNQADFLEETIRSVLEQDYEPIEYVIVDDGSTDGTVDVIRRYEDRFAWWTTQENAGQAAALNRGFAHTSGQLMSFLNSDDVLLPDAVGTLVEALGDDPDVLLAYGDAVTLQGDEPIGTLRARDWDPRQMVRTGANPVPQQASMWRRQAWELAGPFDESLFFFFEYEFLVRLSSHGRALRLDRPLAKFRLHGASKTVQPSVAKAEDSIRLAETFFRSERVPPALRRHARRGRASHRFRAALVYYQAGEIARARREFLRALVLAPLAVTRLHALLLLKSLVPEAIVRRRRASR
jgi:GT2 family glycosyltransferase